MITVIGESLHFPNYRRLANPHSFVHVLADPGGAYGQCAVQHDIQENHENTLSAANEKDETSTKILNLQNAVDSPQLLFDTPEANCLGDISFRAVQPADSYEDEFSQRSLCETIVFHCALDKLHPWVLETKVILTIIADLDRWAQENGLPFQLPEAVQEDWKNLLRSPRNANTLACRLRRPGNRTVPQGSILHALGMDRWPKGCHRFLILGCPPVEEGSHFVGTLLALLNVTTGASQECRSERDDLLEGSSRCLDQLQLVSRMTAEEIQAALCEQYGICNFFQLFKAAGYPLSSDGGAAGAGGKSLPRPASEFGAGSPQSPRGSSIQAAGVGKLGLRRGLGRASSGSSFMKELLYKDDKQTSSQPEVSQVKTMKQQRQSGDGTVEQAGRDDQQAPMWLCEFVSESAAKRLWTILAVPRVMLSNVCLFAIPDPCGLLACVQAATSRLEPVADILSRRASPLQASTHTKSAPHPAPYVPPVTGLLVPTTPDFARSLKVFLGTIEASAAAAGQEPLPNFGIVDIVFDPQLAATKVTFESAKRRDEWLLPGIRFSHNIPLAVWRSSPLRAYDADLEAVLSMWTSVETRYFRLGNFVIPCVLGTVDDIVRSAQRIPRYGSMPAPFPEPLRIEILPAAEVPQPSARRKSTENVLSEEDAIIMRNGRSQSSPPSRSAGGGQEKAGPQAPLRLPSPTRTPEETSADGTPRRQGPEMPARVPPHPTITRTEPKEASARSVGLTPQSGEQPPWKLVSTTEMDKVKPMEELPTMVQLLPRPPSAPSSPVNVQPATSAEQLSPVVAGPAVDHHEAEHHSLAPVVEEKMEDTDERLRPAAAEKELPLVSVENEASEAIVEQKISEVAVEKELPTAPVEKEPPPAILEKEVSAVAAESEQPLVVEKETIKDSVPTETPAAASTPSRVSKQSPHTMAAASTPSTRTSKRRRSTTAAEVDLAPHPMTPAKKAKQHVEETSKRRRSEPQASGSRGASGGSKTAAAKTSEEVMESPPAASPQRSVREEKKSAAQKGRKTAKSKAAPTSKAAEEEDETPLRPQTTPRKGKGKQKGKTAATTSPKTSPPPARQKKAAAGKARSVSSNQSPETRRGPQTRHRTRSQKQIIDEDD